MIKESDEAVVEMIDVANTMDSAEYRTVWAAQGGEQHGGAMEAAAAAPAAADDSAGAADAGVAGRPKRRRR